MKSIIQADNSYCFICKMRGGEPLDCHHVFGGANRKVSEQYGLKVYLHHESCHIFGVDAVHRNAVINKKLQAYCQSKAMKHYGWSEQDFRDIFGKSYLI